MKNKYKIILVCLITIVIALISLKEENTQIRVRVISNSDNSSDIKVKEEVSKVVIDIIKKYNINYDNICDYIDLIDNKIEENFSGLNYQVTLEESYYDAKTQKDTLLKSGYYKTLLVTIENGNGKNYFSILYPNYYNEYDTDEVIIKSYLYEKIMKYWGK